MRLTNITCSYFKKYVQREIAKGSGVSIYKPIQGWRHVRKREWIFDENRPWTDAAKEANYPGKRLKQLVEPIPESEWKIFKGDRAYSTMASAGRVKEGILMGMGNPLLDISIQGNEALLQRYGLQANNAVLATPEQHEIFHEIVESYTPNFIAGGATQNSIRIAQWLLETPNATTFFGGVGDDRFRHILEDKAREVGVNVRYQVYDNAKTGVCAAIIIGENRSLITELGAAQNFCAEFLLQPENWSFVEKASFYYVGGFLLSVSQQAVLEVAKHSSASGKTLVMNLHATFLCKFFADPNLDLMKHVDILFGNSDEAVEFANAAGFNTTDVREIALKTSALHKSNPDRPRIVIVTQGRDPTIIATQGRLEEMPVHPVDPACIKDTNGCGDAFVGGFLSQLVQGKSLADCLRCGEYAAKVVLQRYGCTYPDHPEFS